MPSIEVVIGAKKLGIGVRFYVDKKLASSVRIPIRKVENQDPAKAELFGLQYALTAIKDPTVPLQIFSGTITRRIVETVYNPTKNVELAETCKKLRSLFQNIETSFISVHPDADVTRQLADVKAPLPPGSREV